MNLISFGIELNKKLKRDRATGLASEQAYYYLLALFPLLILLLSILPYLSIEPSRALEILNTFLPSETATVIHDNILEIFSKQNEGLLTFGIVGTIWSASSGMDAFMHSMNIAFDVEETRGFIKTKCISILLTFCLIFAFLVALLLPVFGNLIFSAVYELVFIPDGVVVFLHVIRWLVSVVVIAVVISILYRFAPNRAYRLKQVIPGAFAATVVWLMITVGFTFYVNHYAHYSSTYGSLGAVIVLMLWLYFTGFALVLGGEVNSLFHRNSRISKRKPLFVKK
ncbi:YihY/virulence factor BrkB family protein [Bacillus sp. V59.32b]|uniref:YihY/virulence factor BrkB family protein n=1 Tax=Bacillus sp. V59.32b TaxID=1758642 RepID=UPI000E3CA909|nr:YihY/virulence factor BrkB family protein [Bacillus sp. V59.32b]RFU68391.1 YihY/virulence factor BrkB family protein [Bacillus sp. V59.32b]